MADTPASLDLTLHVDPSNGKATVEAEIEKDIAGGIALDADVQVDQDGHSTVTVGVKIPF